MNNEEKNTTVEETVSENSTTKKTTKKRSTTKKSDKAVKDIEATAKSVNISADEEKMTKKVISETQSENVTAPEDASAEEQAPVTEVDKADESLSTDEANQPEESIPTDEATQAEQTSHLEEVIPDGEVFPVEQATSESADTEDEDTSLPEQDADGEEEKEEYTPHATPTATEEDTNVSSKDAKAEKKKTRTVDSIFDFVELFVFTLAAVLIITSFFFRHSIVDGPSMMGTLQDGETLIISDFMYTPKVGDIIVCEDYTTALKKPIVKRVIATEGQTVRITRDAVYIDCDPFAPGSKPLDEPYVYISDSRYNYFNFVSGTSPMPAMQRKDTADGAYYELTVPEGEVFVMGDHRNNSTDSRTIGTISVDSILGRVMLRVYPFSEFGTVK